jgi:hypothetical protein
LRRWDDVNAAILINKRDDSWGGGNLAELFLNDHLHQLIDRVAVWPRGNLFQEFTAIPNRKPRPGRRARSS